MGGELPPGTNFAGHRIDAVAGRGGMGVVYRATQLGLDRTVALKVIAAGLLDDNTVRARFLRESKIAASIDHPNVIPVYYAGEDGGVAYIAMRYVAGDDIRSLVRREGPLAPERAARIVAQIGSALDAAHAAGLVHRDIKPANVLLAENDHVYLTDFGLTKHALSVAGTTKTGHWVGTLDYVSPEQIRGERVDARADVYALGCLLFYTLTGQVPFPREGDEARIWAHVHDAPPVPSRLVPTLPAAFDDVISRALAKQPDDRYPSAGDLGRAALAAVEGGTPAERERLVAKGAAAPIESPTVSAARVIPLETTQTKAQPEDETVALAGAKHSELRRNLLLGAALAGAAAVGVIAAVVLGVGDDAPSATVLPTPSPGATPAPTASATRKAQTIKVGNRPNVVVAAGDNIFVGSYRSPTMSMVSATTGKVLPFRPRIGVGASGAEVGFGTVWIATARSRKVVRLDPRTGRPNGKAIAVPGKPGTMAVGRDGVYVAVTTGTLRPDILLRLDPKTGATLARVEYPYGIKALATSPNALWIADRRRARVERADPKTGKPRRVIWVGKGPSEDAEYHNGALWLATPNDDTVYKLLTRTEAQIPISVGAFPRHLAIGDGVVYVTSYKSSEVTTIDEETSSVLGEPLKGTLNPFTIDVDKAGAAWVTSPPDNTLTKFVTGRGA